MLHRLHLLPQRRAGAAETLTASAQARRTCQLQVACSFLRAQARAGCRLCLPWCLSLHQEHDFALRTNTTYIGYHSLVYLPLYFLIIYT